MTNLARKLRLVDYFALGFGVMVGTAWLVVMDDILNRGGPLGAALGFSAGALILLPIGYVYGQLVREIPDAAGEAAYVAKFFPPAVSFATGWMMFLSYFLTLNTMELYRLGGYPVYLPHVLLGLNLTLFLTWLNYRGIQASARLSKATTFTFLTLVVIFALAGASHGSTSNLHPLFSHAPLLSILLVWQVVPWLVSGFESVGKVAEEASPEFAHRNFSVAILLTIFSGLIFFLVVIGAVSYVAPWQSLQSNRQFPTAVAFEQALHAHWIVALIMGSAMVALVQAFNANVVASSRLLFAMSRRNLLNPAMSRVHPNNQTPSTAVIVVGIATAATIFLGEALLVPILEVGAVSVAIAWMAACASYYKMKPGGLRRVAALWGLLVTAVMILVKIVPWIPGHFTWHEWLALAIWGLLGAGIRATRRKSTVPQAKLETSPVAPLP
ncbi:MAG: hypothetical protein DMG78_20155 [Acidobacteria bacterium]|nr:MAG: hypothetical protein DMG78_20155 [Acidobacteriota bacterium]